MGVWPTEQETLVLPVSAREVVRRLQKATQPPSTQQLSVLADPSAFLFNGQVKKHSFRLSRKIARPNNFLPFIAGSIEPTSQGCLLFVRYRLFSMTILFLVFWSVVTTGFALYLAVYEQLYHYAALSVGVGVANYVIAVLNFRKQVVISRRLLREVVLRRN